MNIKELIDKNIDDPDCKDMTICLHKTTNPGESKLNAEILWEGVLSDIPEKFYTCNITAINRRLSEIQNGLDKYHIEIEN